VLTTAVLLTSYESGWSPASPLPRRLSRVVRQAQVWKNL